MWKTEEGTTEKNMSSCSKRRTQESRPSRRQVERSRGLDVNTYMYVCMYVCMCVYVFKTKINWKN